MKYIRRPYRGRGTINNNTSIMDTFYKIFMMLVAVYLSIIIIKTIVKNPSLMIILGLFLVIIWGIMLIVHSINNN